MCFHIHCVFFPGFAIAAFIVSQRWVHNRTKNPHKILGYTGYAKGGPNTRQRILAVWKAENVRRRWEKTVTLSLICIWIAFWKYSVPCFFAGTTFLPSLFFLQNLNWDLGYYLPKKCMEHGKENLHPYVLPSLDIVIGCLLEESFEILWRPGPSVRKFMVDSCT